MQLIDIASSIHISELPKFVWGTNDKMNLENLKDTCTSGGYCRKFYINNNNNNNNNNNKYKDKYKNYSKSSGANCKKFNQLINEPVRLSINQFISKVMPNP